MKLGSIVCEVGPWTLEQLWEWDLPTSSLLTSTSSCELARGAEE